MGAIRLLLILITGFIIGWFIYSIVNVILQTRKKTSPPKKTKCSDAHLSLINEWLNDGKFFGMLGIGTRKVIENVYKEKEYSRPEKKILNHVKEAWVMYNKMKVE